MNRLTPSSAARDEQLIAPLVPDVRAGKAVVPAPLPALPPLRLPAGSADPLLDVARMDSSGRFSARGLLAALGWGPGRRLLMDAAEGRVVIGPSASGQTVIGPRGLVAVPVALRHLCGIDPDTSIVLLAMVAEQRMTVWRATAAARLLADRQDGDRRDQVRRDG